MSRNYAISSQFGSSVANAKQLLALALIVVFGATTAPVIEAEEGADRGFKDDFTGTALRPEWKVVDEDPDRWGLVGNEYLLSVMLGTKNRFVYTGRIPQNCEIIAKFTVTGAMELNSLHNIIQAVNVGFWVDPKNYVEARFTADGPRFLKVLNDVPSEFKGKHEKPYVDTDLYFKVVRRGAEYVGFLSSDGVTWLNLGTHFLLKDNPLPSLSTLSRHATEIGVKFDYFEIRPLD